MRMRLAQTRGRDLHELAFTAQLVDRVLRRSATGVRPSRCHGHRRQARFHGANLLRHDFGEWRILVLRSKGRPDRDDGGAGGHPLLIMSSL